MLRHGCEKKYYKMHFPSFPTAWLFVPEVRHRFIYLLTLKFCKDNFEKMVISKKANRKSCKRPMKSFRKD